MKKLITLAAIILNAAIAYSLPSGNPSGATLYQCGFLRGVCSSDEHTLSYNRCNFLDVGVGFYGNYVFDRNLNNYSDDFRTKSVLVTQLNTNAGVVILNICDRLELFSSLGASKLNLVFNSKLFTPLPTSGNGSGRKTLMDFSSSFSWSVGGRCTLWGCRGFMLGLEGEYFQTNPELNYIFNPINSNGYTTGTGDYHEWQVGLGLSYWAVVCNPMVTLAPYVTLTCSDARLSVSSFVRQEVPNVESTIPTLSSEDLWGYAIGATLMVNKMVGVTVEGRWASEKALYVSGELRF